MCIQLYKIIYCVCIVQRSQVYRNNDKKKKNAKQTASRSYLFRNAKLYWSSIRSGSLLSMDPRDKCSIPYTPSILSFDTIFYTFPRTFVSKFKLNLFDWICVIFRYYTVDKLSEINRCIQHHNNFSNSVENDV